MTRPAPPAPDRPETEETAEVAAPLAISSAQSPSPGPATNGPENHEEAPGWDWEFADPAATDAVAPALLPGKLSLPEQARALIIVAATDASFSAELAQIAEALGTAGMATVIVEALSADEARFANLHHNTPLLTQRLLDLLALIEQRYAEGGLPVLPIGIYAVGDLAPAAVRAAAQRDRDVEALVCRGGLIDLAGLLYLRTLTAPLLHIIGEDAAEQLPARRALARVEAKNELLAIADADAPALPVSAAAALAEHTVRWFAKHLRPPGHARC